MAILTGKKAFIFGVLNEYSIGWHIAQNRLVRSVTIPPRAQ